GPSCHDIPPHSVVAPIQAYPGRADERMTAEKLPDGCGHDHAKGMGICREPRPKQKPRHLRRGPGSSAVFGGYGPHAPTKPVRSPWSVSGRNTRLVVRRLAQDVAAAPHGLDVVLAAGGVGELLAQLADEHVDDLEFRLVHAAIEMIEEHLLGERRAF